MKQLLYTFLLFWIVNFSFGQTDMAVAHVQSDSSLHKQDDKKKALDYIILNGYREDTIWCEVTKIENNQIYYTTPNKDEWVKDFQDICNLNGKVIHCERTYMPPSNQWEYIGPFEHGYARVYNKTRYAYIDSTGKCESDCPFEDMGKFRYGYTWACNKNKLSIINSKCEVKFTVKHIRGERSAAFFDSIIVIYAMKKNDRNFGAVDYNFNIIIPHEYSGIHKSSSERYYFVARASNQKQTDEYVEHWGIYDMIARKEIVPCSYPDKLVWKDGVGTYTFGDDFLKEVEKLKLSVPVRDEISDRINEKYDW
ncbi:MAG: WG repeat-containing protein [Bacteroidetes bacterium]|nr:WG repeat-containing protein [Bacteroidota bacterium]